MPADHPVSVYVHIPFGRRLCWFCACRTQGTKTLSPVADYIDTLVEEIAQMAAVLPQGLSMRRLHLGGGTPSLLPVAQLDQLMGALYDAFPAARDLEVSVEIDPTDASDEVLSAMQRWGLNRASIGVQDFAPEVRAAIGRVQSFAQVWRGQFEY